MNKREQANGWSRLYVKLGDGPKSANLTIHMITKYILDGYNVIYKIPKLANIKNEKSLEQSRNALVLLILDFIHKRPKSEAVIVFDGRAGEILNSSTVYIHGIKCYFTKKGVEADDYIGGMLSSIKDIKNIVVISEDGKVANKCKVYGAEIRHPSCLDQINANKTKSKDELKNLSSSVEREITNWYRDKLKDHYQ